MRTGPMQAPEPPKTNLPVMNQSLGRIAYSPDFQKKNPGRGDKEVTPASEVPLKIEKRSIRSLGLRQILHRCSHHQNAAGGVANLHFHATQITQLVAFRLVGNVDHFST